jgi:two-component system sensor histidine kinase RegB
MALPPTRPQFPPSPRAVRLRALVLIRWAAVAATILSFASTLAICFLAIVAISFIALLRRPLPWVGSEPELPEIYVGAIWVGLVLTTFLIAIYAWRVAEEARRMSAALSATSAALAREQQMSALGALAASAAHELGTPLGTITLIARELQREVKPGTTLGEDIQLLAQEAARCRDILTRLTLQPTQDTSDAYRLVPLPAIVETAAAPYKRPEIAVHFSAEPAQEGAPATAPLQIRSAEILQGLGNLLQNAIQFARSTVMVHTGWTAKSAWVEIEDDGPGFAPDVLDSLGEPYISTRDGDGSHMGLGVFIAKSLLERSGARLSFANGPSGGAHIVVEWPEPRFKDVVRQSSKEAAQ